MRWWWWWWRENNTIVVVVVGGGGKTIEKWWWWWWLTLGRNKEKRGEGEEKKSIISLSLCLAPVLLFFAIQHLLDVGW